MIEYRFLIAEKCILFKSSRKFLIRENLKVFQIEKKIQPDLVVEILYDTDFITLNEEWKVVHKNVFEKNGDIVQRYHWQNDEYIFRLEPNGRDKPCRIGVPKNFADAFCESGDILNYLALDRLMIKYFDCVYFHSSLVLHNKETILFSAPSHGGKSSQAKLWESYTDSMILNGDKSLLKIKSNKLISYGSPIAGTSKIYHNLGAPVKVIIFINKGTKNQITTLSLKEAYIRLYSQMVKSLWDEEYNKKVLSIVETILQMIPVVELECTLDKEAVECVIQYMKRAD